MKNHPSLTHAEDFSELCKPLERFNITRFAKVRMDNQGGFTSLCNHPEFLLHYLKHNYQYADISARTTEFDFGNYLIWDFMSCFGKTERMLNDAAEFQYKHIFTIMKHGETHSDFYHFGTHLTCPEINQWYINHLNTLHLFID